MNNLNCEYYEKRDPIQILLIINSSSINMLFNRPFLRYIILIGIILLVLFLANVSQGADDNNQSFQIVFKNDSFNIIGNYTQFNKIHINGTCKIPSNLSTMSSYINWTYHSENNITLHPIPTILFLYGNTSLNFYIETIIPPKTPAGIHTINLTAILKTNEQEFQTFTNLYLNISQYYGCIVSLLKNTYNTHPKGKIQGIINIHNIGNGDDNFDIIIEDLNKCIDKYLISSNINVKENEMSQVNFTFYIKNDNYFKEDFYVKIRIVSNESLKAQKEMIPYGEYYQDLLIASTNWTILHDLLIISFLFILFIIIFIYMKNYHRKRSR